MPEPVVYGAQGDVDAVVWVYKVPADRVPRALRAIAQRLESTDGCLLGLWSTGFDGPENAVLQVLVDAESLSDSGA